MNLPQLGEVESSIRRLACKLQTVGTERIPLSQSLGRVLAAPLHADRDSPPSDVSAMDGYALRHEEAGLSKLPVSTTITAGSPPVDLRPGEAIRVFTGASVPPTATCVVRREDTIEASDWISLRPEFAGARAGMNIRKRGENIRAGELVLPQGTCIDSVSIGAVATFAPSEVEVFQQVRVAVLATGDELVEPGNSVVPWQIRDSNQSCLVGWLQQLSWCQVVLCRRVPDTLEATTSALRESLQATDAVILTGGVSMGDTDFVPTAVKASQGTIEFHRLPIRPGKPVLGAHASGKLILGLPGNPVSVAVTSRIMGLPLLQTLAGNVPNSASANLRVHIGNSDGRSLPLHWYRLVDFDDQGNARLIHTQGSGDLVSLAMSRGFIEQPPHLTGAGPWRLWQW